MVKISNQNLTFTLESSFQNPKIPVLCLGYTFIYIKILFYYIKVQDLIRKILDEKFGVKMKKGNKYSKQN